MNLNTETQLSDTASAEGYWLQAGGKARNFFDPNREPRLWQYQLLLIVIMVKEEEIMAEAGVGRGYMDLLGLGEDDHLLCLPPSSYFSSTVVPATTATSAAASSPTCASYLDLPPAYYHHMLSLAGQEQQYHGDGVLGFQYLGGVADHAIPAAVPHKSSPPTTECSSSISSMSSSPPATAVSAVSCSKPQAFKKKGSRSSEQRKAASAAAAGDPAVAAGATTNKRPRVRRERLGERIIALQQLVSPFGKSDTASVLHEALGYIRFLHDQVQVLSSPYMQRQPASAHVPESAAGTVVEPPMPRASDLRSRGLCLVPVSCTEHLAGNSHGGNGADLWSVAAGMAKAAAADNKGPAGGMLQRGGGAGAGAAGHPYQGHLA